MENYFAVETKCGHVGKNQCIYIWFAIKAENGKEAATKAKTLKRVKRDHKDVIRQMCEITREDYFALLSHNNFDPYLKCTNIQQQRKSVDLTGRIEPDEYLLSKNRKPMTRRNLSYLQKKNAKLLEAADRQIKEYYNDYDIAV